MISSSCPLPFLSIPPSFPWHFLGMSASFSMYVPFIASHFPTSPFVSFGFLVLCFPFILPSPPLFSFLSPSFPFQFSFVSLAFPLAFLPFPLPVPCMPCISLYFLPFISLHFPAFPFTPGHFPEKTLFVWDPCFATPRCQTPAPPRIRRRAGGGCLRQTVTRPV